MSYDYKSLEVELLALLTDLGETLAAKEIEEVHHFIEAGEYGVAFETLCSILNDEQKAISTSVGATLRDLGGRMDIDPECWRNIGSR